MEIEMSRDSTAGKPLRATTGLLRDQLITFSQPVGYAG
jgi:hypothetical protein